MIEVLLPGIIIAGLLYWATKKDDAETTVKTTIHTTDPPPNQSQAFEKHIWDLTADRETVRAALRFYDQNPDALTDADLESLVSSIRQGAHEAWENKNPHDLGEILFNLHVSRMRAKISREANEHAAAIESLGRSRVDTLSHQGTVVDKMFALLDAAPMSSSFATVIESENGKLATDEARTIDSAAASGFYLMLDEASYQSATIEKDGVSYPVFKEASMFMAGSAESGPASGAPIKLASRVAVMLDRFVKAVESSDGKIANVYVGEVTSSVPVETYGKRTFVFAPESVKFDLG